MRWIAAGAVVVSGATSAGLARAQEPPECLDPDPAKWPAPSKPYFMIAFDNSGSMVDNNVSSNNSCGYTDDRLGHARCAVRNTLLAFGGQANFGLAQFATDMANCSGACFADCTTASLAGNETGKGCGAETDPEDATDSSTRRGANIVVPLLQDNFFAPPPIASNVPELLKWVDDDCSDNKELYGGTGTFTPLNGILRDMYRYLSDEWVHPSGSPTLSSPLASLAQGERPCRSVNVILVTDGVEFCDQADDSEDAAADLLAGFTKGGIPWSIKTYVIDVGDAGSNADGIAAAGGTVAAQDATDEQATAQALAAIISGTVAPEVCNNADDNCNGCTDEGFRHYCDVQQTCCAWQNPNQRDTCLNDPTTGYLASINAGDPDGDLTRLPCTTVQQQTEPANWLCFDPKETCDGADNNCDGQIDEGVVTCGNPPHCPSTEVCGDGIDNDCNGGVDDLPSCLGCIPSAEVCDGCDNDCNDIADDGVPPESCSLGAPPVPPQCMGSRACKAEQNVATGGCASSNFGFDVCVLDGPTTVETCNGIDDDCDGSVDDSPTDLQDCVPAGAPGGLVFTSPSACVMGHEVCESGIKVCKGFVGPGTEFCDGIDSNCNGVLDENDTTFEEGTSCGVSDTPPCQLGQISCVLVLGVPTPVCQNNIDPGTEVCNDADDDCDGLADEPPLADAPSAAENGCWDIDPSNCLVPCIWENLQWCAPPNADCADLGTLVAPCKKGLLFCEDGGWVCKGAKGPQQEVCDNFDNDCNGVADNGVVFQNPTCSFDGPPPNGLCQQGSPFCDAGQIKCTGVLPSEEICDAFDNDCDGETNEDLGVGDPCIPDYDVNDYPGVRTFLPCTPGAKVCNEDGSETCEGGQGPSPETCNGLDDDCDGEVDEVGAPPDGLDGTSDATAPITEGTIGEVCGQAQGLCAQGVYACVDGEIVCLGGSGQQAETCDCEDNDCDGVVDNQTPNGPPLCAGSNQECVKTGDGSCQCATPCTGEFCPGVSKCETVTLSTDGSEANFCVVDLCPTDCSAQTIKDTNDKVLCAPAGTVLENCTEPPACICGPGGGCQDPCNGVTCSSGQVCATTGENAGKCVTDNCYGTPCPGCGEACFGGTCKPNPCDADDPPCPPAGDVLLIVCKPDLGAGTYECVGSCAGVDCGDGQRCVDGECAPTCSDPCGADETCDEGASPPGCVTNECTPTSCPLGNYCNPVTGQCGEPPCEGILCPALQVCQDGECVLPDETTGSGSGGAGATSGPGSGGASTSNGPGAGGASGPDKVFGLATGGGGCACRAAPGAPAGGAVWAAALGIVLAALRRAGGTPAPGRTNRRGGARRSA